MFTCLLFGLVVLGILFLIPLGGSLFPNSKWKTGYKYVLLGAYVGGVLWLTLVKRLGMEILRVRFQPFYVVRQMLNCWFGFKEIASSTCRAVFRNSKNLFGSSHASPVEDLFLNIILFVPFGFLLPYLFPKLNAWKTILLATVFSSVVEAVQYFAHMGCCDIDDVINNVLGTCIGYACWAFYKRMVRR